MKTIPTLLLCLMPVLHIFAQESIDLLTLSGQYGVPQSYESRLPGKATEYG